MVKLTLISPKGNNGVRFFPYTGYLGLTSLKFEGVVRTEIEQDGKLLPAKDVTVFVRCYEFRQGRLGTIQANILVESSVTLWRKPEGQDWAEIGNVEYPFRLSMPLHTSGPSTALYFQEYRICWRIEAVVNHAPVPGVGSRLLKHYDLNLIRHDLPGSVSPPSPVTPPPTSYLSSLSTKSRGPSLRYRILLPPTPVGPLDIVSLQVTVQPLDPAVSIRSATAVVERRIQFSESPISPPGALTPSAPTLSSHSHPTPNQESHPHDHRSVTMNSGDTTSAESSYNDLSSSSISHSDTRPLLPQRQSTVPSASPLAHASDRTATHIFAHLESSHRFTRDSTGTWRQTLTFSWPDARSNSRWTIGETLRTDMTSVKFFIRVKLIVSSPNSSAETVELDDKEIIVVSTNDAQRQLALSRYSAARESKSRSPKRSKRNRPNTNTQLPSPPRSPPSVSNVPENASVAPKGNHEPEISLEHIHKISSASSPQSGSKYNVKSTRRPHTSAGPRDTPHGYDSRGYNPLQNHSNRLAVPLRPETAYHSGPTTDGRVTRGAFNQKWVEAPRLGGSSTNVSSEDVHSSMPGSPPRAEGSLLFEVGQVEMRAWEEELARIELVSRKSTADMMDFVSQRRKLSGQQVIRTYVHADR
ncbi:uncharacterized protein EDB91DRAFT_1092736 [Suillus paluster]|uniref:uncharacterized protein n=1 Tax=Suillus paluster TaxID=48578 RepID=UPI001B884D8B|nr:uncharacterized protein EDB91DRAFT_1092736 [Suillus paluster]KAG1756451.1 hypothetical protein EDB91DRAFT_1092736 [Suillus paluster]